METEKIFLSEGIDRLINLDLGARGIIYKLYDAARDIVNNPLTLVAGEKIVEKVGSSDYVIIVTGFRVPPNFIQETDGPPGAVSFARAVSVALNAKPIVLIEESSLEIIKRMMKDIGVDVNKAFIEGYPIGEEESEKKAEYIIKEYSPSLILAIEKAGKNIKGVYHNMKGLDISPYHSKIEKLIELARREKILTLAVGDGGNEVGMGNIWDTVVRYVPYGDKCQCPCSGGIAAKSKVDILVTAAVSNWGAYGIEAMLSYLTSNKETLHTPEIEEKMLRAAIEEGAIDGVTGESVLSVDGIPLKIHKIMLELLKTITSSPRKK